MNPKRLAEIEEMFENADDAATRRATDRARIRALEVEVAGLRAELTRAYAQIALLHTAVPA